MKFREEFIKRKTIFHGEAVGFRVDTVGLPNGREAVREYVDHPGAAAVIPIRGDGKVVMVRQFRHPVGQITWEIPAGKLTKGESPLACLKRELREETGYRAKTFKKLLSFWPTPAFGNEIIHVYLATGLKPGPTHPDPDEFLSTAVWPFKKILSEIKKGRIKDSKTIVALLAYKTFCR